MTYLDFAREADEQSTSWTRADPRQALVERVDAVTFRVMLTDGSASHECHYAKERGAYVGSCDCKGHEYRDRDDSACAHLCTLRKAEFIGATDTNDLPIYAQDSAAVIEPGATEPEPEVITDGGTIQPPAAGSDGVTFGRPEFRR